MMQWWKRFNDWLKPEENHLLYEPMRMNVLQFPKAPQEPAEWSAKPLIGIGETTTMPQEESSTSETVSDESEDSGNVTTETALEHADDLPSSTFRVFPSRADGRNGYDTTGSARAAVLARQRRPYNYGSPGGASQPIKVYQAETVWRDVTDEYVKPDGQG